ncbi:MAG: potassium channel family protein [Phycisphaerae bacterium]|nr:potassium channel family protein [Phycisphaerae bacterium]
MWSKKLSKPIKDLQHLFIYLIEDVPLYYYGIIFVCGVFILGVIYFFLTPYSNGVGTDNMPLQNLTFWNAQYFSVVTVSSLGYGDMHPMGFSKILACLEVLSGLVLMGIILAKTTSARISYHVVRLFSSETQKRMEGFANEFEILEGKLRQVISSIGEIQGIPGEQSSKNQSQIIEKCTKAITNFYSHSSAMAEYLSYEVDHCKFFAIAPVDSIKRTADAIDQAIHLLGQVIISTTTEVRGLLLNAVNRRKLLSIIEEHKRIVRVVHDNCTNHEIQQKFSRILTICNSFPESFYAVPVSVSEKMQPDQKLDKIDEPQLPS